MPETVLIVEDKDTDAYLLVQHLQRDGLAVHVACTARAALAELATRTFDCVLLDKELPDMDGIECLRAIRQRHPRLPVVIITGHGSEEVVTAALRLGAADYIKKVDEWAKGVPAGVREVLLRWESGGTPGAVVPTHPAPPSSKAPSRLPASVRELYRKAGIVGASDELERALCQAHRAAERDARVLLVGDTGTGKELFARGIHGDGPRAPHPFVAVNCGAIADGLLDDALFGHVRGAYTGAEHNRRGYFLEADHGTLFLDEIESASPRLQSALLRVIEDGLVHPIGAPHGSAKQVDVRVISASKGNLREAAEAGRFRSDLFFRLSVLTVRLPLLRERAGDIGSLMHHYLRTCAGAAPAPRLTVPALERLHGHPWPGNVRELRHVAEALVADLEPGAAITAGDVDALLDMHSALPPDAAALQITSEQLNASLARNAGRINRVAQELGVSEKTIRRYLRRFGIDWRRFRKPQ